MAIRKSKIKSKNIILPFILLAIIGSKQREHKKEIVFNTQIGIVQFEKFPDHLENWAKDLNSHIYNQTDNHLKPSFASPANSSFSESFGTGNFYAV